MERSEGRRKAVFFAAQKVFNPSSLWYNVGKGEESLMDEQTLQKILATQYGIESASLEFLREGGSHTYVVNGKEKNLLKVIGPAFLIQQNSRSPS